MSTFTQWIKQSALVTAALVPLTFAVHTFAMPDMPEKKGGDCGMMQDHHMGGMHGGMFGHLKNKLSLTPEQDKLWTAAQNNEREMHHKMMGTHQEHMQNLKAQLAKPDFDPRAMITQMKQTRQQHEQAMDKQMDMWLAMWDSLSADQRTTLRNELSKDMDRMGGHGPQGKRMMRPDAKRPAPTGNN